VRNSIPQGSRAGPSLAVTWLRLLLVVALIGLCSRPALGQTSANGSIRGVVRDSQQAVLPQSVITVTGPTMPVPVTAASDGEGYYRLVELPPGEYELTAERQGFATFVRPGIVVRAGLNLLVDVNLELSAQETTITVNAETPMLESSSAVQAIDVSGDFQRQLPLTSRRDWAVSLLLVPGVTAVPNATGKLFYYLHGADFSSIVMQLDGADIASTLQNTTGYINLSTEAIQDVQIKTGALDASTPIGAGAILSVVSQSGTNRLQGNRWPCVSGPRLERE
jgi:carboxypeptidase family protein